MYHAPVWVSVASVLLLLLLCDAVGAADNIYIGGIFNQFYEDVNSTVSYALRTTQGQRTWQPS